jgi:chondroitin 4-sulfotransferase 11
MTSKIKLRLKIYKDKIQKTIRLNYNEVVFMHIPKTAGSSVINLVEKYHFTLINHDLRNEKFESLKQYLDRRKKKPFVFTFVRNPWDRVLSAYSYLIKGGTNEHDKNDRDKYINGYNLDDFNLFIKKILIKKNILKQIHFRPQHHWIYNEEMCLCDHIAKYNHESLQSKIDIICRLTNVPQFVIPQINISSHAPYTEIYDEESKEIVAEVYAKDINLFNYSFEEKLPKPKLLDQIPNDEIIEL